MKKYVLILLLVPSLATAQYWGERVTERSFEQSSLYFNRNFLNPFGVDKFEDVAIGMIDDPFLSLHLNPSRLPSLKDKSVQFYLDFRGDRTEEGIISTYYGMPMAYAADAYYYIPDPRWYSTTRSEPEPVFSVGILSYPLGKNSKRLFLGGTYQSVYKQEKYYRLPSWIYYPRVNYDAFGEQIEGAETPIEDRYYGKDELLTEAHLATGFIGYELQRNSKIGFSINMVSHSREGGYVTLHSDEYGSSDDDDYRSFQEREKDQRYSHVDFCGGLSHSLRSDLRVGVTLGYLSGDADQEFLSVDSSLYRRNEPHVSTTWSYSRYMSQTLQTWDQDGHTVYGGFDFERRIDEQKTLAGYYRVSHSEVDMRNASTIEEMSHYSSRWVSTQYTSEHEWNSSTSDQRTATGSRKRTRHQVMMNVDWTLTPKSELTAGLYYSYRKSEVNTSEPVIADRRSAYWREYNTERYATYRRLYEEKRLEWAYSSREWSLEVPIILTLPLHRNFSMLLGVNRVLKSWRIEDETVAFFDIRREIENDDTRVEENFGERYHQPDQKFTEDYTDLIISFEVAPNEEFKIRLTLDPEFGSDAYYGDDFRIAQWWLSFHAML